MAQDSGRTRRRRSDDDEAPRVRLTERDRAITRLIARWGPLTQPQVARGVEMSRLPSFRRLQALREAGFLHYERPVDDLPGIFTTTSTGIELAGLLREAPGAPPAYALWPHLATADAAIEAELRGARVANRYEILSDPALRAVVPTAAHGGEIPPRALILGDPPVAIYATVRPALAPVGVGDELATLALEAYASLEDGRATVRVLVPDDVCHLPAVTALTDRGIDVVAVKELDGRRV